MYKTVKMLTSWIGFVLAMGMFCFLMILGAMGGTLLVAFILSISGKGELILFENVSLNKISMFIGIPIGLICVGISSALWIRTLVHNSLSGKQLSKESVFDKSNSDKSAIKS